MLVGILVAVVLVVQRDMLEMVEFMHTLGRVVVVVVQGMNNIKMLVGII